MSKTLMVLVSVALLLSATMSAEPTQDDLQIQQQEFNMKRTACLVLSRYHSNTRKDELEVIISGLAPEMQQKYINKMYATAIEHCLPKITMDEAQKVWIVFKFSSLWRMLISPLMKCSTFTKDLIIPMLIPLPSPKFRKTLLNLSKILTKRCK